MPIFNANCRPTHFVSVSLHVGQGTPRGEGAKKVMKLSFHKIAGLQEQLQAEQKRAQSAESRLSELEGDAQRLWETVMRNSKMEAELRAKVEQVEGQAALAETEKSEAQAEARSLEARVLDQTRQLQRVNEDKEGALAEIAGLREQLQEALDDARAAANRGTPRGEGAKKVLKLALVRIKELNERIDVINAEVKQADERAEQVQVRKPPFPTWAFLLVCPCHSISGVGRPLSYYFILSSSGAARGGLGTGGAA